MEMQGSSLDFCVLKILVLLLAPLEWLDLDKDELIRVMQEQTRIQVAPPKAAPGTGTLYVPSTPSHDFDKGIRRSINDYKTLRDRKHWNVFQRSLLATAHMHGVGDVLDITNAPPLGPGPDKDLFDKQERFMFSIFTSVLLERTASEILRRYSDINQLTTYGKVHSIYQDLVAVSTSITDRQCEFKRGTHTGHSMVNGLPHVPVQVCRPRST
jgi:hypothetical protein